jgi:hypothetical protein
MGADLIGFLVKGPKAFTPEQVIMAKGRARAVIGFARELTEVLENEEEFPNNDIQAWAKKKKINLQPLQHVHPEHIAQVVDCLTAAFPKDVAKQTDEFIDEFVAWWENDQYSRDSCFREDPDDSTKWLVFAGDQTWGDPPDGYGYESIQLLVYLGADQMLGIK